MASDWKRSSQRAEAAINNWLKNRLHGSAKHRIRHGLVACCSADVGGPQLSAFTRLRSRVCCTRPPDGLEAQSNGQKLA
ncbi:hypothetical protein TorRG33x02_147290 [Trema orientale]|uniref:Uncharacterized protein n=1 Tax=Trema orientale TaxID=63057 RepID=A0A2P5EV10_TREOI|nr:hypothetical protein TorRG33x02_147290 [Trema orientale]